MVLELVPPCQLGGIDLVSKLDFRRLLDNTFLIDCPFVCAISAPALTNLVILNYLQYALSLVVLCSVTWSFKKKKNVWTIHLMLFTDILTNRIM